MAKSASGVTIIRDRQVLSCEAGVGDLPSGDILIRTDKIVEVAPRIDWATIGGTRRRAGRPHGIAYAGQAGRSTAVQHRRDNVLPINGPYGEVVTGMDTINVRSVMVGGK